MTRSWRDTARRYRKARQRDRRHRRRLGGLGFQSRRVPQRLGIGHIVLVDFDVVDITNLNRQHYTMKGSRRAENALRSSGSSGAINPYLNYETYTERVVPANVKRLFSGVRRHRRSVRQAGPEKAMLIENVLTQLPDKPLVSGSGIGRLRLREPHPHGKALTILYLCGDGKGVADGQPQSDGAARCGLLGARGTQ